MSMQIALPPESTAHHSSLRGVGLGRIGIGHALVDNCSTEQACLAIINHARRRGKSAHIVTPNAQHIVLLDKDPRFREIYRNADLVIADGISLLLAARFHGRNLQERIAGVDVFRLLCGHAAANSLRVFLLGGRPGSADLAADVLREEFPSLHCSTYCPPYGFEKSEAGLSAIEEAVKSFQPHILFVGFGAPKQEQWIYDHGLHLAVPVCIGIGGSFELVGGVISRAPKWIQSLGCEWLYRFCCEPRRLWRRYLIGNLQFAQIVLHQRVRRMFLNACMRLAAEGRFGAELNELNFAQSTKMASLLEQISSQQHAQQQDSLAG